MKYNRSYSFSERVNAFKTQIQKVAYNICIVFYRYLYRRSVSRFKLVSYKDLKRTYYFV